MVDMLTTLHIQRYQDWQDAFLRDIGANWAKVVNPPEGEPILQGIAHTLIRFWCDDVAAGYIAQGYEGGRRFVCDQAGRFGRVQAPGKVLELWNEPDCNTNTGLRNLNSATLGAIDEARLLGVTLCILNLAEGNPHDNGTGNEAVVAWKWDQLRPCIKAAVSDGHYLGRHCYWRPDVEGPTGRYHALGRLADDIEKLRDLGVDVARLHVLVNEWGIDGGIAGHTPQQGWRVLTDPDTYRAQIVQGEIHAGTIPQVHALVLFTSGYEGQWASFEHDVSFCGSLIAPLTALYGDDAIPEIPPGGSMPDTTRLLAPLRRDDVVRVTQRFTPPSHYGIDYSCYEGTPIFASCDGIAYRGNQPGGFGLYVRVEDCSGLYVYAAHLRAWAVADGALVQVGDLIGYSGNTGNSTGPHLHFEVRDGSRLQAAAIDPTPLIAWPAEPEPAPEPLPNDEQGPPATLAQKARWWCEEMQRQFEANNLERAEAIRLSLIDLLYRLEGLL